MPYQTTGMVYVNDTSRLVFAKPNVNLTFMVVAVNDYGMKSEAIHISTTTPDLREFDIC